MTDPLVVQLSDEQLARLAEQVAARLSDGNHHAPATEEDQLLSAPEAAAKLGVKLRWLYGHARTLPFVVRLPGRGVRFSARGIQQYIERHKGR